MLIKKKADENKIVFLSLIGGMSGLIILITVVGILKYSHTDDIDVVATDTPSITLMTDKAQIGENSQGNVNAGIDTSSGFVDNEPLNFSSKITDPIQSLDNAYVSQQARNFAESMKERKTWSFTNTSTRGTGISPTRFSADFIQINTQLYQVVEKYYTPSNFASSPYKEYIDPLYIMAVSNVEFGEDTSPNTLLAPAIPTRKGVIATKENILTFGIQDYLKYPNLLANDRDGYRGPLQMYVTGLADGIVPGDLVGNEYTRVLSAPDSLGKKAELSYLQYLEGSGVSSTIDGMRLENKPASYGDRFNYGDSVNRLSQYIKECWNLYDKNSSISKSGEYAMDTKYAFMAMSAIGHNSSPGMYYVGDAKTLGSQHYWWPFSTFGDARKYCHYLGSERSVAYIKDLAYNNIKTHKDLEPIFRLTRTQGYDLAMTLVEKGLIPSGLWKRTCWNHEEKVGYPIQVLYNYFLLEAIYEGIS